VVGEERKGEEMRERKREVEGKEGEADAP